MKSYSLLALATAFAVTAVSATPISKAQEDFNKRYLRHPAHSQTLSRATAVWDLNSTGYFKPLSTSGIGSDIGYGFISDWNLTTGNILDLKNALTVPAAVRSISGKVASYEVNGNVYKRGFEANKFQAVDSTIGMSFNTVYGDSTISGLDTFYTSINTITVGDTSKPFTVDSTWWAEYGYVDTTFEAFVDVIDTTVYVDTLYIYDTLKVDTTYHDNYEEATLEFNIDGMVTASHYLEKGMSDYERKSLYSYDVNGNITSLERYYRYPSDVDTTWRPDYQKYDLEYNTSGKLLRTIISNGSSESVYDPKTDTYTYNYVWSPTDTIQYTYTGELLTQITSNSVSTVLSYTGTKLTGEVITNSYRRSEYQYAYDGNGRMTLFSGSSYALPVDTLSYSYQYTLEYDAQGNLVRAFDSEFEELCTYDASGNVTSMSGIEFEPATDSTVAEYDGEKETYTYAAGLPSGAASYTIYGTGTIPDWANATKEYEISIKWANATPVAPIASAKAASIGVRSLGSTLMITIPGVKTASIKLFSLNGREVADLTPQVGTAGLTCTVDTKSTGLATGAYILSIKSANLNFNNKVLLH